MLAIEIKSAVLNLYYRRVSLHEMTLRKISIDNSVRCIPKSEQTRENKTKTIKAGSLPRKQNKKISQNNKKFLNNVSASGFKLLK